MGDHLRGSSSDAERYQANQQVRSGDLYDSAMGNISGGIMRFNISAYKQTPGVDHTPRYNKESNHGVPQDMPDSQVAPGVKGYSSPPINSQGPAKD